MNLTLTSAELWNWSSPVWLVALAILLTWLTVVRSLTRLWIVLAGLMMLVLIYISPIGVLADGYLFSAHMLQHLVLLLVVPLCLVLALPARESEMGAPERASSDDRRGHWLSHPAIGWFSGVGAMWLWHMPTLCTAATEHGVIGVIRDSSLLVAGLLFWWPVFSSVQSRRLSAPSAVVYLFSACLGCTLLGIYITFTEVTVCPAFSNPVDRIGILNMLYTAGFTRAVDQSLGGLFMWVPPCFMYVSVIIGILCRWYGTEDMPRTATAARGDLRTSIE